MLLEIGNRLLAFLLIVSVFCVYVVYKLAEIVEILGPCIAAHIAE